MDDALKKQIEELMAQAGELPDTESNPDVGKSFRGILNAEDKTDEWMKDKDKEAMDFISDHAGFFTSMMKAYLSGMSPVLSTAIKAIPGIAEGTAYLFKFTFTIGYIAGIILSEKKDES